MIDRFKRLILLMVLLASPVEAADPHAPLGELPVVDSKLVVPEEYRAASALLARITPAPALPAAETHSLGV